MTALMSPWQTQTAEATPAVAPKWAEAPATQKQIDYIHSLLETRNVSALGIAVCTDLLASSPTKAAASAAISRLVKIPFKTAPVTPKPALVQEQEVTVGIWDLSPEKPLEGIPGMGRWAIVYQGQHGLRAKRLYKSHSTKSGWSWKAASSYGVKQMIKTSKAKKVSVEDIAKLGQEIGFCMYCTRVLSDPESMHRGYGPVCAHKYDLPWG